MSTRDLGVGLPGFFGRSRDRLFVEYVASALDAGWSLDAALARAMKRIRKNGANLSEAVALRAGRAKLENPELRRQLAEWVEQESGLSASDAMKIRAAIIRGEITESVVTKDGEVVAKPAPVAVRLRALEGYEKLVYVPQTHRVEVDSRSSLSAVVVGSMAEGVPAMSALPVGGSAALEPVTIDADEDDDEDE